MRSCWSLILSLFTFTAQAGTITTVAGSGTAGYGGDGGPPLSADLQSPWDVAFDSSGNMYISDYANHCIRKVDAAFTIINPFAGTCGTNGFSGDSGPAINATLYAPRGIAFDSSGNLYIADSGNQRIRKVDTSLNISTVAGSGGGGAFSGDGGVATIAELNWPDNIAFYSGNLYIADTNNQVIRMVNTNISTIAGQGGTQGWCGSGGAALGAKLNFPAAIAFDSTGNMYIADSNGSNLCKITGGTISMIGTGNNFPGANDVVIDSNDNVYVAEENSNRIRKVDPSGNITTVVGTGTAGSTGDNGPATSATINLPRGVTMDSSGNLYIVEAGGNRIRKVILAEPEIDIKGGTTPTSIVDGDTTPSTTDDTDFGSVNGGSTLSKTFTVYNTGPASLTLSGSPLVAISGTNAAEFTVTTPPTSPVAATTGTTTFTVQFAPSATGLRTATVTIANDDSTENPYNFNIQGTGNTAPTVNNATFSVSSSATNGTVVGTVPASDVEGNIKTTGGYSITAGNTGGAFAISDAGQITVATAPLTAAGTSYSLTVQATDTANLTGTGTVTINVTATPPPPVVPPVTPPSPSTTSTTTPPVEVPPPPPVPRTLHIQLAGTGQGGVTSDPVGLDCSATSSSCTLTLEGPQWVYLTTTPAIGSQGVNWMGDPACTEDGPGKVFLSQDTTCTATFDLKFYTLTVERNVLEATVTGDGINCPDTCEASYPYGTTVKLVASPAPPEWEWVGWAMSCDNQGQVVITQDRVCRARYQEDPKIPNGIDGNGDGLNDAQQPNVMSLADKMAGSYITLVVNPECVVADGSTVTAEMLGGAERNHPMPQGLMAFELQCSQTPVTMYFHGFQKLLRNLEFRKYGPKVPGDPNTVGWYKLPNVTFNLVMVGGKPVVTATYTLVDGQLGDSTGVDGRIVDPAGLGYH